MRIFQFIFALFALIPLVAVAACSSGSKSTEHLLHKILLYNLHLRRPGVMGADPKAVTSEDDGFQRETRPNGKFDCESIQELFKKIDLNALRSCFRSIDALKERPTVYYRLKRDIAPQLMLEEPSLAPPCLQSLAPAIPVPREIIFQSNEEGRIACYSSRISPADEEFLGVHSSLSSTLLKVAFPLERYPHDDVETLMLLTTWTLTAFLEEQEGRLVSKLVPDSICQKCMGKAKLYLDTDTLPPAWP